MAKCILDCPNAADDQNDICARHQQGILQAETALRELQADYGNNFLGLMLAAVPLLVDNEQDFETISDWAEDTLDNLGEAAGDNPGPRLKEIATRAFENYFVG